MLFEWALLKGKGFKRSPRFSQPGVDLNLLSPLLLLRLIRYSYDGSGLEKFHGSGHVSWERQRRRGERETAAALKA